MIALMSASILSPFSVIGSLNFPAGEDTMPMDVQCLITVSHRNPIGTSEMMVNRVGIIVGLVVTVRIKQFVTWVMMTMVAIWEHIVPKVMETVLQFVMIIADVTWEIIVLLAMIWEDSNALESAAPIVIGR